jgi:hypothetical protein
MFLTRTNIKAFVATIRFINEKTNICFCDNMKTITVDDDVWGDLLRLKADLKVRTYSEVLRRLIQKWKQ